MSTHGMPSRETVEVEIARLSERFSGLPVLTMDEISAPKEDGRGWTFIKIKENGAPVGVLLMTTESYYECLKKAIVTTLPSLLGRLVH